MEQWFNNNRRTIGLVLSHASALSFGISIGSYTGLRAFNKFRKQVDDRSRMVAKAADEIVEIMNDVTLSGEEREKKIVEIYEFMSMLLHQKMV